MHQTTLPDHWKCFHWCLWRDHINTCEKKTRFFMFVDYYRDSNSKCMHYMGRLAELERGCCRCRDPIQTHEGRCYSTMSWVPHGQHPEVRSGYTDIRRCRRRIVLWVVTFAWVASDRLWALWECAQRLSQLICDGKSIQPIQKRFTGRFSASL